MNKLEQNFGLRVEELIQERNIRPFDFYKEIGIIPQNFYDWKKKGAIPNAATAYKVAKCLGVTIEYLLTGESENPLQAKVEELQKRLRQISAIANERFENT